MSLTLKSRPLGVTLGSTQYLASITNVGGYASVNYVSHGLVTGDYVFITYNSLSAIFPQDYFGFWKVEKVTNDAIYILDTKGVRVPFTTTAISGSYLVTYYKANFTHYYNALHLPINYTLYSDSWPSNAVDTQRTVSSIANDNGYMQVTVSGDIRPTGASNKLDWVKITNGDNNGIYQIINYTSNTVFTINMSYDASSTLGGDTIQYYYQNYYAAIKIYGGLGSGHYVNTATSTPTRSFELICTIKVIPGSDNYFSVNVADYLKKEFDVMKNNTLDGFWPLDNSSFCQFYISYADAWDVSNGTSVTSTLNSYTQDSDYGYAINSALPFGNRYSGYLSEYVYGSSSNLMKFLTPMQYPTIFPGQYWDISLINQFGALVSIKKEYYLNGVVQSTSYDTLADFGSGVYRNQLTIGASEDRIDLTAVVLHTSQSLAALNTLTNYGSTVHFGTNSTTWSTGAAPSVTTGALIDSKYLYTSFRAVPGYTYTINYNLTGAANGGAVYFIFFDGGGYPWIDTSSGTAHVVIGPAATVSGSVSVQCIRDPVDSSKYSYEYDSPIFFGVMAASTGVNAGVTINSLSISAQTEFAISETKSITVDSVCSKNFQDKYVDLCWKNYLGGHDYWRFKAFSERGLDILETRESERNIYQTWPNSYNEFQDTITQETMRRSKQTIVVRAENLTQDQLNDLFMIKASPLVQICNSRTSKKTVIVDKDSFVYNNEKDNLQSLSFKLTMTNELPVQSL